VKTGPNLKDTTSTPQTTGRSCLIQR